MAEAPAPRSPLAGLADALSGASAGGVTLADQSARARLNLRLDPEDAEALTAAGAALGGSLPRTPNTTATTVDGWTLLWLGPDEWLVTGPAEGGAALEDALRARLDGHHHALTDVSAMYATLALSGPRAREVLMKGCRLGRSPPCLRAGHLRTDGVRQGAGDPAPDRRRALLRDHGAQLVLGLPRYLAARRHGGVPPGLSSLRLPVVSALRRGCAMESRTTRGGDSCLRRATHFVQWGNGQ